MRTQLCGILKTMGFRLRIQGFGVESRIQGDFEVRGLSTCTSDPV